MFSWEFDFDAGFFAFTNAHPGWLHIGNRMKVTGAIYDVFELWIAPPDEPDPGTTLGRASWNTRQPWTQKKPTINVLSPIAYDHNVSAKGRRHAQRKR